MKQLLILSGKGGTGKTTIASAFIKLSHSNVFADCDVDAPNLHLIMGQSSKPQTSDYYGMPKAEINTELCTECDQCRENCRFYAISADPSYHVDLFACEGCGVCEAVCSNNAIMMTPAVAGQLMLYKKDAVFSTAQLKMGHGTSGKLVSEVKSQMRKSAPDMELAIIDGSPGIGCPVIASLSGVSMVLIVAEPSLSGISDMERIIKTAHMFGVKIAVCVNKYDTNIENTQKIEDSCREAEIYFAGKIPYDPLAVNAINAGLSIIDSDCQAGHAVKEVYQNTMKILE